MTIDLDEAQQWRHSVRVTAEYTKILQDELVKVGLSEKVVEGAVETWLRLWLNAIVNPQPDLVSIFGKMIPQDDDD